MKIVLLSEAPMALNEGGICQTLYNLFCFIPQDDFLGITPIEELKAKKPTHPYDSKYISYKSQWITLPSNRISGYFESAVRWINLLTCESFDYKEIKERILFFNPNVIISCPNSPIGVVMHNKLLNDKRFEGLIIPYFMDDWMYAFRGTRLGRKIDAIVASMLQNNARWMMISKELSDILKERYDATPKEVLHIRNPVDLQGANDDYQYERNIPFTIAYAGALWQMHYDSFLVFAKAVKLLSATIPVRLILYTPESFWNWRRNELEPVGVIYGGHIAYADIHNRLHQADALLLTSSFFEEYLTHSRASLQTKITDYCKAKRLIISCGPTYSANHFFLKQNECGVCIETSDVEQITARLTEVVQNIYEYQGYVRNAWEILKRDFSREVIHRKIQSFLSTANNS